MYLFTGIPPPLYVFMIDQYERYLVIMCPCLSAKQAPPSTEGLLGAEFLVFSAALYRLVAHYVSRQCIMHTFIILWKARQY